MSTSNSRISTSPLAADAGTMHEPREQIFRYFQPPPFRRHFNNKVSGHLVNPLPLNCPRGLWIPLNTLYLAKEGQWEMKRR